MSKNKENKFILQKSTEKANHWVFTDEENLVSIIFENRKFNETQKVKLLQDFDTSNATELARIMSEMANYLRKHHNNVLSPITATEKIRQLLDNFGMSSIFASEIVGLSYGAFRTYMANFQFKEYHVEKMEEFITQMAERIKQPDYYK